MAKRKSVKRKRNPVPMGGYNKATAQIHKEIQSIIRFTQELVDELEQEEPDPDIGTLLGRLGRVLNKLEDIEEIFEK